MPIAATLRASNEPLHSRFLIPRPQLPSLKMPGERLTIGSAMDVCKSISSTETWPQCLTAYLVGLGEQHLAQWGRNFEDLRQAGFYGNQAGESEVQETLDLLERIRTWATTWKESFHEDGTYFSLAGRSDHCSGQRNREPARSRGMLISCLR
jgi:hypothetical protein